MGEEQWLYSICINYLSLIELIIIYVVKGIHTTYCSDIHSTTQPYSHQKHHSLNLPSLLIFTHQSLIYFHCDPLYFMVFSFLKYKRNGWLHLIISDWIPTISTYFFYIIIEPPKRTKHVQLQLWQLSIIRYPIKHIFIQA